jgi:hypothetical protein
MTNPVQARSYRWQRRYIFGATLAAVILTVTALAARYGVDVSS